MSSSQSIGGVTPTVRGANKLSKTAGRRRRRLQPPALILPRGWPRCRRGCVPSPRRWQLASQLPRSHESSESQRVESASFVASLRNHGGDSKGRWNWPPHERPVESRQQSNRQFNSIAQEEELSARHKLNAASLSGSAIVALLIGALTDSWGAFWITFVILIACSMHSGEIRPSRRRFGDRE